MSALTDAAIKAAKPGKKAFKLYDERGLYLLVNTAGGRWWRLKFRADGKEKLLSLGVYPEVSLKQARERRDAARKKLADNVDISAERHAQRFASSNSFESIAREWFEKFSKTWKPKHSDKVIRRFELYLFPWVGSKPIGRIEAPELLICLRRVEGKGAVDTAKRVLQSCGRVFRYAIATGRASRDPSADLRGAIPPTKVCHLASFTEPSKVGELLRAIEAHRGSTAVSCALRLAPLVFVRPGELRGAKWEEIDFQKKEWRIAADRMKMGEQHIVPLSRQAIAVLEEIKPVTGRGTFVFPSARTLSRPLSDVALLAALRRMGFEKGTVTVHGFRSTASTLLNEQGWSRDAIERQLAHGERDGVRAAYNFAEHLPERRKMMQAWADYLETLKGASPSIAQLELRTAESLPSGVT